MSCDFKDDSGHIIKPGALIKLKSNAVLYQCDLSGSLLEEDLPIIVGNLTDRKYALFIQHDQHADFSKGFSIILWYDPMRLFKTRTVNIAFMKT